jgi:hypothetical protein
MDAKDVETQVNKPLRATLAIAWKVSKFRLRMALHAPDSSATAQATTQELSRLVSPQTAHWEAQPRLSQPATMQALQELNERSTSAFILSIRGERVRLWKKRQFSFDAEEADFRLEEQRSFLKRAMLYRAYLEAVLRRSQALDSFDMALDVTDLPEDSSAFPIFSFQKQRGAHNLLLPDVDFFHSKWYPKEHDELSFDAKAHSACFVGSSTGNWHTVESIRKLTSRRLQMADYFHQHPRVVFRIANAAQCLSEEAKTCLMSQRYFSSYVSWEEQLRHRFLIVMDGNGATCSRLVKGLMSNSVVVKFDSPHQLYYFAALEPGSDYLLVDQEADLERIVECEAAHPGSFKEVALHGQRFAAKYLTMTSVMDYTALLLKSFAALNRR